MSGSLTIQMSEADVLMAYRLHYSKLPRKTYIRFALMVIIIASGLALIRSNEGAMAMVEVFAGFCLFGLFVMVIIRKISDIWWLPKFVRRVFAQQSDLRDKYTFSWDDMAFRTKGSDSYAQIKWSELYGWRRSDRVMLLYRSEILFHFVVTPQGEETKMLDDIQQHLISQGVAEK